MPVGGRARTPGPLARRPFRTPMAFRRWACSTRCGTVGRRHPGERACERTNEHSGQLHPAAEGGPVKLRSFLGLLVAIALFGGCTNGKTASSSGGKGNGCIQVNVATSPEKGDLLTALARSFNGGSDAKSGGTCVFVNIKSKASGRAATALANGWDESAEGPRPVVWSPASSSWGAIVDQRLADKGQPALA